MWDLVGLDGTQVIGLQEVGGFKSHQHETVVHHEVYLKGKSYTFFCCSSSHAFRGSALGIPSEWLSRVERKQAFCTGLGIVLKHQGTRQFLMTAHLPHNLRKDCLPVWQTQVDEILTFCSLRRFHDTIGICADLNYDVLDIVNVDERGVPLGKLLRELGLSFSKPSHSTWHNTRGSESRIDYLLFSLPSMQVQDDRVHLGSDEVIGSDHCVVSVSLGLVGKSGRRRFKNSRCGKWWINAPAFTSNCEELAEQLDLSMQDLSVQQIAKVCQTTSKRITSCRYVDGPEIKAWVQERKALTGAAARRKAKEIADARKQAKHAYLCQLLERGAAGDFRALTYFRKRNSAAFTQGSYCMRAGGITKALTDLRLFYKKKFTPADQRPKGTAMAIFRSRTGPIMNPAPFTLQEIQEVAFMCKHNKSTGEDGISYEAIQLLLQTTLARNLVELFNSILMGLTPPPPEWLSNHVTFLPKTADPKSPSDLRPIVLSSTVGKVFTKCLMLRMRPRLPLIRAFQVGGIPSRQTLDSACAVQHAIRLAQQYGKTLYVVKLDISAAFDSLSHEALAVFLSQLTGCREAEVLLQIITNTTVTLGLQGTSWQQELTQGILQGSSYSAELFARCVDHYLAGAQAKWQQEEATWLQTEQWDKLFLAPFADDLVLLGTTRDQTQRLLKDSESTLQAIGLYFNSKKCKFLRSPGLSSRPLILGNGSLVECEDTMLFLGILLGFHLTCVAVLAARMAKVGNAFWGYLQILRQTGVGLKQRLKVFDCFVTSRWRWLSPAVRPTQAVQAYLKKAHTTFLMVIMGFQRDPFQGAVDSWIAKRRASRLAAQQMQHRRWEFEHVRSFFGYWGHAARYDPTASVPIALVLQVRGPEWLFANHDLTRRLPGRWPDASRLLQLTWERYMQAQSLSPVCSWIRGAQDRARWKDFSTSWAKDNNCEETVYYKTPPECLDLKGRMLVQNGDFFSLLPIRHVPVEAPYAASFEKISHAAERLLVAPEASEHLLRVFSDGSASQQRKNDVREGGAAVVVLPPYGNIQEAIVSYFRIQAPCTNIEAELRAACHAMYMIESILRAHSFLPIQFCTDSQYVLQIPNGSFVGTHHASVTNELICRWSRLSLRVEASHVRAHKGHLLNEIADHFAKQGRRLAHYRKVYRTLDSKKAAIPQHPNEPPFVPWL